MLERRIDETLEQMASYRVAVAIDRKLLEAANRAFLLDLLPTLAGIVAGLLGAFALQGGIALWPIARARHVLREVRDGRLEKLSGALPSELEGLAAEFDALLEAQRHGARRARERAADLAHGLRTPLALLAARARDLRERGEAEAAAAIEAIAASIDGRMARELARAHIQGPAAQAGAMPLQPVVERVARAFARMPGGAHLSWRVEVAAELASAAEEGDLVELLGVLLDNAAKWARSEVRIAAQAEDGLVSLTVEDDGPGIPPQDRRAALARGGASGSGPERDGPRPLDRRRHRGGLWRRDPAWREPAWRAARDRHLAAPRCQLNRREATIPNKCAARGLQADQQQRDLGRGPARGEADQCPAHRLTPDRFPAGMQHTDTEGASQQARRGGAGTCGARLGRKGDGQDVAHAEDKNIS